ncbi:MAG: stage II sporulation protein E [Pelotomaculum sp.]|nr:stage II sporulation protein E [Pelotomaculum sp.]
MDSLFENIEIYPYKRSRNGKKAQGAAAGAKGAGKPPALFRAKAVQAVTPEVLAACFAGFFLGRAVLLGELLPFGTSFAVAALRVFGRSGLAAIPAVVLGLITVSGGASLAGSIATVICASLLTGAVPRDAKRPWLALAALVLAVTIVVKASFTAFTAPSAYNYFTVLFEAVFAALLTPAMIYGISALKKRGIVSPFSGEEVFCILLVFGGLVAGTGDLKYWVISVKGVLSRLTIMLAAFVGGTGIGAAAGAVVGIIPGLVYTAAPAAAGAYSFAGLLAGACRGFGKAGVATGFILGNIILSVYIAAQEDIIAVLTETAVASLLFLLFPSLVIENLKVSVGLAGEEVKERQGDKPDYRDILEDRVKSWARVFGELSRAFEQASSTAGQSREEQCLQRMLNQIGEKVCCDCAFYRTCWDREFYKTYQGLIDLLALLEIYGKVTPDNLSDDIKRRCSRTKELAITVSCLYESYNLNRYWSRRLVESREIVSEQLKGISEVIAGLPGDLEFEAAAGEMGPALRKKLKDVGAQIESLSVYRRRDGGVEVALAHLPCGGRMECRNVILPLLSSMLEHPLYAATTACTVREEDSSCHLIFYPRLPYRLVLGAAGTGKSGSFVSGDSYAFFHLKGGRFGLALSDGMGTGPQAALESGTTVSLLRRLLESGFGQDVAIKTVNSVLILRSPGESFATVDLTVVDLNTGQADLVKIGAAPTFIIRGGKAAQVRAGSLPAGIIEDIEVVSLRRALEPGDVLVMVTDGILDAYHGPGDREEWLAEVLLQIGNVPPQEMAELILKLAQTAAGGPSRVPDDMTVVVARLEIQKDMKKNKTGPVV